MNSYACCICEEPISNDVIAKRHYSAKYPMPPPDQMVCSRECEQERRSRNNFYKQMSEKGRSARSKAVTKSNKENPRRKKER